MLEARKLITHFTLQDNSATLQAIHANLVSNLDNLDISKDAIQAAANTVSTDDCRPYTFRLIAPCPHLNPCPLVQTHRPCHFPVPIIWPVPLVRNCFHLQASQIGERINNTKIL